MQCRQVGDMTKDIMSPTGHTMLSANEGLGRHDRLRHSLLRQLDRVLRRCQYTHGRNDDSKNAPQQCHINKMSMILQHWLKSLLPQHTNGKTWIHAAEDQRVCSLQTRMEWNGIQKTERNELPTARGNLSTETVGRVIEQARLLAERNHARPMETQCTSHLIHTLCQLFWSKIRWSWACKTAQPSPQQTLLVLGGLGWKENLGMDKVHISMLEYIPEDWQDSSTRHHKRRNINLTHTLGPHTEQQDNMWKKTTCPNQQAKKKNLHPRPRSHWNITVLCTMRPKHIEEGQAAVVLCINASRRDSNIQRKQHCISRAQPQRCMVSIRKQCPKQGRWTFFHIK